MARSKRNDPKEESKEIAVIKEKIKADKEKSALVETPTDKAPKRADDVYFKLKEMEKKRYNALLSIETSLAKTAKQIKSKEAKNELDDYYIGLLSEMSKHAKELISAIDKIPEIYMSHQPDTVHEIIIRVEEVKDEQTD